ncbi:MAG: hypothetical protein WD795_21045 [Woeseia sp.]
MPADAQQVLARRIDGNDQKVPIENNRAAVEIVDDVVRQVALEAAILCASFRWILCSTLRLTR